MSTFLASVGVAILAVSVGLCVGIVNGTSFEQKKLGTAICKKLSGSYARLDDQPVCINPNGGILKFYD